MKNELFPFQKTAVWDMRKKAAWAVNSYNATSVPQILSLQAPTGSGKTLMMAALISCIPMIVIYVIFQKQFIEGIATSRSKL